MVVRPVPDHAGVAEELLRVHLASDARSALRRAGRLAKVALAAQGASVVVVDPRLAHEGVVTSPDAAALDRLELTAQDGPAWTAAHQLTTVHVPDVSQDERWPRWSTEAVGRGTLELLCVGLATPGRRTGAMVIASDLPRRFTDSDVQTAQRIADHLSTALGWFRKVDDRDEIIRTRRMIGVAIGRLMARYGLSDGQAFELMRRHSHVRRTKVRDLARYVAEHGELPSDGPD